MKVGAGTLTLNGTNLYAGSTVVSNGILVLSGTADANPSNTVAVRAVSPGVLDVTGLPGGTLYLETTNNLAISGDGTIQGNVVVGSGAPVVTVAPGTSAGKLTISGDLTLSAATTVAMELDVASAAVNDQISAGGTISVTGSTLTVTNIGPLLSVGQVFTLFNKPVTFATVNIATNDAHGSYVFQNNLAANGTIQVLAVTPNIDPNPTNVVATFSPGQVALQWPSSHTGWILQVQTNTLAAGLSTATNDWYDVPNSETTNMVTIPITQTDPAVFYRLRLP